MEEISRMTSHWRPSRASLSLMRGMLAVAVDPNLPGRRQILVSLSHIAGERYLAVLAQCRLAPNLILCSNETYRTRRAKHGGARKILDSCTRHSMHSYPRSLKSCSATTPGRGAERPLDDHWNGLISKPAEEVTLAWSTAGAPQAIRLAN